VNIVKCKNRNNSENNSPQIDGVSWSVRSVQRLRQKENARWTVVTYSRKSTQRSGHSVNQLSAGRQAAGVEYRVTCRLQAGWAAQVGLL